MKNENLNLKWRVPVGNCAAVFFLNFNSQTFTGSILVAVNPYKSVPIYEQVSVATDLKSVCFQDFR